MSHGELVDLFMGFDAMIYAVGPDDRYTPDPPAYEFFHKRLVIAAGRVVEGAKEAGVKKTAICNSYFAYFDRIWPDIGLSKHHPYIKARVEQADHLIQLGGQQMDIMILELPYIFGTMPGRTPIWKELLISRLKKMKTVMFPKGGTSMISVEHVAEALLGAIEKGKGGERYPVGDVNMEWKEMLAIMLKGLGIQKKIKYIPTFLGTVYGYFTKRGFIKQGKEPGLDYMRLFRDIQARFLYFDPTPTADVLGYGRGGIEESILKTMKACL